MNPPNLRRALSDLETLCRDLHIVARALPMFPPDEDDTSAPFGHDMLAWSVRLTYTTSTDAPVLTVPFYQGLAHKRPPTAADVLYCLASDACAAESSFEDWCSDQGLDTDSRRAKRTFRACRALAPRVRRFLGEHFDAIASAEH